MDVFAPFDRAFCCNSVPLTSFLLYSCPPTGLFVALPPPTLTGLFVAILPPDRVFAAVPPSGPGFLLQFGPLPGVFDVLLPSSPAGFSLLQPYDRAFCCNYISLPDFQWP